jgi:hypothetical protein
VLVGLARWRMPAQPPTAPAPAGVEPAGVLAREPRIGGLAILTRGVDVLWEPGGATPGVDSVLSPGVLRFRSGVVQIEFHSGATVIVEGPAEIELKAIDRIACRYGKLRALVPPSAHGFRVDSASVALVDLGTEFGMRVAPDRRAEVHVFNGKVELQKADPRFGQVGRWELAEGHGLRIDHDGDITPLSADPAAFLAPPDLERLYRKEWEHRYGEWQARSRALTGDPRLVAYFSFEANRKPGSRILVNHLGHGAGDGAIVGCEWVDGRWPGKGALEFKRPSDRVRIHVPGEFRSLTFAAWVRIDAIEHRFNGLMLTDGFDPGETHWQIDHQGRLVLGVRNHRLMTREEDWPLGQKNYTSPPVITPEKFGRWIHLATIYDHGDRNVTHYVNGAAVWSEPLAWDIPLRIGGAELGNWGQVTHGGDPTPIRNLCGRMDEFALFREALSAAEVRGLYERGDAYPSFDRRENGAPTGDHRAPVADAGRSVGVRSASRRRRMTG